MHERAAADVVPVGVDVDLPGEESRLGLLGDLLPELLVERHLAAEGAVRARGLGVNSIGLKNSQKICPSEVKRMPV